MGFDKAMAPVGGATMLEAVVNAVAPIGDVVVVGRSSAQEGLTAVPDCRQDARGPLTGLETVLTLEPGRTVVLVAVDHPFVRTETLSFLLELEGDAVVPIDAGWQQVTCSIYRPAFLEAASSVLNEGGRSIIAALDRANTRLVEEAEWQQWGEDGRSWFSVDSLDRLHEGTARFG